MSYYDLRRGIIGLSLLFSEHRTSGRGGKTHQVQSLHQLECHACPLNRTKHQEHPKMGPTGAELPIVYILGEAPGKTEDEEGVQFIGDSGPVSSETVSLMNGLSISGSITSSGTGP